MPDVAAAAFEGYGVMIIGVAKDSVTGVPPVEMMEISKVIQKYVGAAGPRWDIVWVPIKDSDNQVLAILVDPPQYGRGPFPCRANGDSLVDGRIYIRADGETREAKSDEIDLLMTRASDSTTNSEDFQVDVLGEISAVQLPPSQTVEEYLDRERARLLGAIPQKESGLGAALGRQALFTSLLWTEPEDRTEDAYIETVDHWIEQFRSAWGSAVVKIAVSQLRPAAIRVVNRSLTFFHDVELNLHFKDDVVTFDYRDLKTTQSLSDLGLPLPPREWKPRQKSLAVPTLSQKRSIIQANVRHYIPSSVRYVDGGSEEITFDIGELRTRGTYESEGDVFVLLPVDPSLQSLHCTWKLTARDHNDVYSGETSVTVSEARELTPVARRVLGLRKLDDDGEAQE